MLAAVLQHDSQLRHVARDAREVHHLALDHQREQAVLGVVALGHLVEAQATALRHDDGSAEHGVVGGRARPIAHHLIARHPQPAESGADQHEHREQWGEEASASGAGAPRPREAAPARRWARPAPVAAPPSRCGAARPSAAPAAKCARSWRNAPPVPRCPARAGQPDTGWSKPDKLRSSSPKALSFLIGLQCWARQETRAPEPSGRRAAHRAMVPRQWRSGATESTLLGSIRKCRHAVRRGTGGAPRHQHAAAARLVPLPDRDRAAPARARC